MTKLFYYVVKNLENTTHRIDSNYFDPRYYETIKKLNKYGQQDGMNLSKLGELLSESTTNLTGGVTPKGASYLEEGIVFIRAQNVKENNIRVKNAVFIEPRVHNGELRRSKLKPDDVLLTITGVNYGISAIVPKNIGEANINQHCVKIEVNDKILPNYLCNFLNSTLCQIQMKRVATGGTRPALSYPAIKSLEILYPENIDIQKKISDQIDKIYDIAYKKLKQRDELLSNMDTLIQGKLGIIMPNEFANPHFTVNLENTDRLDVRSKSPYLQNLLNTINQVAHDKFENLVIFQKKEKPIISDYYRLIDLRNIEEKTGRIKVKEVESIESSILLHKDQICISCLNPDKGKTILIDNVSDNCVGSNEFAIVKEIPKKINQEYLSIILRSKIVLDQWKYQITGSSPSRERISENTLNKTLIPLPDKDTIQKDIAKSVSGILQKAIQLEKEYQEKICVAKNSFDEHLIKLSP